MSSEKRGDYGLFKVVVNSEGQYSIWPADRENALGWNDAGKSGTREECLAYIKEVWTDESPGGAGGAGRRDAGGASDRDSADRDGLEDTRIYKVVVNHEEQYSIWPADRENALGWNNAGKTGTKQECLEYIKEVWTDNRPLSLRKKMEQQQPEETGGTRGDL
jgi:MbtH protein